MKRIIGALILIVLLALPAFFGPEWAFFAIALVVLPMCLFELNRVILDKNASILGWITLAGSIPMLFCIYYVKFAEAFYVIAVTGLTVMGLGLLLFERSRVSGRDIALALSGMIYPLVLSSFWILIRNGIDGRFWMIFGLACTFLSDTGAYYAGKNLGRHHIVPRLSPKKTLEGLIGGMAASTLLGTLFFITYSGLAPLERPYPVCAVMAMAAIIALFDFMGDLGASLFKREFNVKDMGNLIPGHGGMLDRMDGIIPVGTVLYLVLQAGF